MDLCPWIHRPCADEVPNLCDGMDAPKFLKENSGETWMASWRQTELRSRAEMIQSRSLNQGVDLRLQENRWGNSQK